MQGIVSLVAVGVVCFGPGLAMVAGRASTGRRRGVDEAASRIALLFAGAGLSTALLWPVFQLAGPSRSSALLAAALAAVIGFVGSRRAASPGSDSLPDRDTPHVIRLLALTALVGVATVVTTLSPYGSISGERVHQMAMSDWEKHLVMATAVANADHFPPPHPYVRAVATASYHYGFQLLAAAADLAGGTDDVFWPLLWLTMATAAATPFVVFLLARALCSQAQALLAAIAASLFVGFDLVVVALEALRAAFNQWPLPAGFAGVRALVPSTHIDFWLHNADRQFSAPLVATLWAPHNVAAALVALVAIWLLLPRPDRGPRGSWFVAGLLIASTAALSAYIAVCLAFGVAVLLLTEGLRPTEATRTTALARWAPAGVVALLAALPVMPTLAAGASSGLQLRASFAGVWTNGALFTTIFGDHQWTRLLDSPAVLAIDFGILGVLAGLAIRAGTGTPGHPARRLVVVVSLAIVALALVVRPPDGIGNNLYARGLLLPWFLLAPLAARQAARVPRRWLAIGALICVAGSGYAVVGNVLEGRLFRASERADVEVMRWINAHRPRTSVVAIPPSQQSNDHTYWLRRGLVVGNPRLARLFGASDAEFDAANARLRDAFAEVPAPETLRRFRALPADTVAIRVDGDPTWRDVAERLIAAGLPELLRTERWVVLAVPGPAGA